MADFASRIIELFPEHRVLLETFGGGGSVLLHKQPAEFEIYNDIDVRITRLFRILLEQGDAFINAAALTPYFQASLRNVPSTPRRLSNYEWPAGAFKKFEERFEYSSRA